MEHGKLERKVEEKDGRERERERERSNVSVIHVACEQETKSTVDIIIYETNSLYIDKKSSINTSKFINTLLHLFCLLLKPF